MKALLSLLLTLVTFTVTAQFNYDPVKKIIYDNAEQKPLVSWGIDPTQGYAIVTGGTQNINSPDSRTGIVLTTKYKRKGNSSYNLYVTKRTDYPGCCEWTRSEIGLLAPSQQTRQNEIRWAAVSILIDPAFQFENRPTQIAFDSKASPDDLQTPFWLGIIGDQYYIEGYFHPRKLLGPVTKGVWEDWLVDRNYSAGADGFFRFYRNGKLIYSKSGPNWFNRAGDAPVTRYQHGLYKWVLATANGQGWGTAVPAGADLARMDIYIDEVKHGLAGGTATINDFLIDATAPTPTPDPPPTTDPLPNNKPKVFAGNDQKLVQNVTNINGTASDPDNDALTYKWEVFRGSAKIQKPNDLNSAVNDIASGSNGFRLTVTDARGASDFDTVNITVNIPAPPPNRSPVVSAGADQTIIKDTAVTVATATDPDGDALTYLWSVVSGTGKFSSANTVNTTITGLTNGVNTFRLTVTDTKGAVTSDNIAITYNKPVAVTRITGVKLETVNGVLVLTTYYSDGSFRTEDKK